MAEIALAEQRLRAGLNDWFETQQRLDRRFERLTVAYSGGVDSTVLLWLLASAPAGTLPAPVDAIHVNHDLQTSAHDFQRHCERQCLAWGVPLRCV
ncbi:MAG: hypothetical protein KDK91_29560, partial [Gammaproteobacteria bacterium]|nr:hypothetical protein [Gammaproteobacteria bacterium]